MKTNRSERFVLFLLLALCVFLLPRSVRAQSEPAPQKPARPGETSSVSVASRLVEFDVVVHDGHGNPIKDLPQSDFKVTDNGHRVPISYFTVLTGKAPLETTTLPPNTFTNSPTGDTNIPTNLTIILVDALNTSYADQYYSDQQLIRYLLQLKPTDHVAIYTLGSQLRILQDFTTDDAALVAAVRSYKGENLRQPEETTILQQIATGNARVDPGDPAELQKVMSQMQTNMLNLDDKIPEQYRNESLGLTLAALRVIAQHVMGIPGRKNLLWLSASFPLQIGLNTFMGVGNTPGSLGAGFYGGLTGTANNADTGNANTPETYFASLEATLRLVESADIAIYPVDARGLIAPTAAANPIFANAETGGPGTEDTSGENLMTMDTVANRTGGRAFFNTNAIAKSLQTAEDDAQYSYLLGYNPPGRPDGKFHKVKVEVSAHDAHVRTRQGYFAMLPPKPDDTARKIALGTAMNASLDSTGIPFTVEFDPIRPAPDSRERAYDAVLSLKGSSVHFAQQDGMWTAHVEFVAVQVGPGGKPISDSGGTLNFKIPVAQSPASPTGLLQYKTKVVLNPIAGDVRFIVRDTSSLQLGSLTIPVSKLPKTAPPM